MSTEERVSLQAEKRGNEGIISGLQIRVRYSQDEIDTRTARNAEIDAQLAEGEAE